MENLSIKELAFLWCASKIRTSEIDEWPDSCPQFYMDVLFKDIVQHANRSERLISLEDDLSFDQWAAGIIDWELTYSNYIVARLVLNKSSNPKKAMYAFVSDNDGEGIEVLIEATGDFPVRVRHVERNARDEEEKLLNILIEIKKKDRKT